MSELSKHCTRILVVLVNQIEHFQRDEGERIEPSYQNNLMNERKQTNCIRTVQFQSTLNGFLNAAAVSPDAPVSSQLGMCSATCTFTAEAKLSSGSSPRIRIAHSTSDLSLQNLRLLALRMSKKRTKKLLS